MAAKFYVYFFMCNGNVVKIGVTDDIERRLGEVQTGCPYEVRVRTKLIFDTRTEAFAMERHLHQTFRKHRTYGEWFKWHGIKGKIAKAIRALPTPEQPAELRKLSGIRG